MLILQLPLTVADKDKWPHIGGFPDVLESNSYGRNYGAINIKHYHRVLNPWLQTINVSASNDMKEVLIFYGCPLHLSIYLIKDMGGDGMVALIRMINTSHETNVEDLVTFGIAKIEFQNAKQSLLTERLVLDNTNSLKREDFPCLLKQSP